LEEEIKKKSFKGRRKNKIIIEMGKNILIFLLIIFLLLLSFSFGFFLGERKVTTVIREVKLEPQESKLIKKRYFNITGLVTEISDRTLVLSADGEIMKIPIAENVPIMTYVPAAGGTQVKKNLEFGDIRIDDKVNIFVEEENGKLIGTNVYIYMRPLQ